MLREAQKRRAIAGAVLGIVVVVLIIIAALAGYYAASSGMTGGTITTTVIGTSTLTTTVTVTSTITGSGSSTSSGNTSSSSSSSSSSQTLPTSLPSLSNPISESGSSLLFPLFQLWASNFSQMYKNVQVNTAAGGSGAGQSGVESGTIDIGASDPFLSNAQVQAYPNILSIAVAVSAQQVNYNLPGISQSTHLNFTGNVLAGIYNGTIAYWDDAAIKAINPSVSSQLPHRLIVPLHRSDSSGDTNLFTTYLSDTSPDWAKSVGSGNTVAWPSVPTAQAENGNSGMLQGDTQTQYSIAYIGVSYLAQANSVGLGNGALQNLAGDYVPLTTANVQAAVNSQYLNTPPSERYSLIYGPGNDSYPIVNYEYALVQKTQSSQALATDIQALLEYATFPQYGNSAYFLNQVGFVPLPAPIAQLSWNQIEEITG